MKEKLTYMHIMVRERNNFHKIFITDFLFYEEEGMEGKSKGYLL